MQCCWLRRNLRRSLHQKCFIHRVSLKHCLKKSVSRRNVRTKINEMNNNKSLGLGRTHLRVLQEIKYRTAELPACCTTDCFNQCQQHKREVLNTPPISSRARRLLGQHNPAGWLRAPARQLTPQSGTGSGGTWRNRPNGNQQALLNSQLMDPEDIGGEVKAQVRWTA